MEEDQPKQQALEGPWLGTPLKKLVVAAQGKQGQHE